MYEMLPGKGQILLFKAEIPCFQWKNNLPTCTHKREAIENNHKSFTSYRKDFSGRQLRMFYWDLPGTCYCLCPQQRYFPLCHSKEPVARET